MLKNIHFHYDQLTADEKEFVDLSIDSIFKSAKLLLPKIPLAGDDTAERFANSFALWVIDSRS